MALRTEPSGGVSTKVTSVCQFSRSSYSEPDAAHEGPGLRVVDLEHLLVVLEARDHGVGDGDLAEGGGEFLVLVGGQVLAREEDHLVVEEGLADGGQRLGVERLVQVDVADLGADRAREGRDVELDGGGGGHGFLSAGPAGDLILTKSTRNCQVSEPRWLSHRAP